MKWKDLRIGLKLGIGFGGIFVLLIIMSGFAYTSFQQIRTSVQTLLYNKDINTFIVEKEVDHFEWINQVNDLFLKDEVRSLDVETNYRNCKLGRWLYSEETKSLMDEDPKLRAIIAEIMVPHQKLHESAIKIGQTDVDFDPALDSILAKRWIDHLHWMKDLSTSFMTGQPFNGALNPRQCAFGRWYYNHVPGNTEFENRIKLWEEPHARLHESAAKIVSQTKRGQADLAEQTYLNETIPTLNSLGIQYARTSAWINETVKQKNMAATVFHQETLPAMAETQQIFKKLRNHYAEKVGDEQNSMSAHMQLITYLLVIIAAVGAAISLLMALLIGNSIKKNLSRSVNIARRMSEGDFSQTLTIDQKDEIGVLATALNKMILNLGKTMQGIQTGLITLTTSSTELSDISEQMNTGLGETSSRANSVSAAAEEMSINMSSVATAVAQTSSNVQIVASSTEEMTASITEIAKSSEKSLKITEQAVLQASHTSEKMNLLGKAVMEIGEVTETITDISEKTDLLALNATIEAARAGDVGKGFAVVASEIKQLAKHTAESTQRIRDKIQFIQNSTTSTIAEIEQISVTIHGVNDMVTTIAAAVEEQSITTSEIASNVVQASEGVLEVAGSVEQGSAAAEVVAKDIEMVDHSSNEMSKHSAQVSASAYDLSQLANQLKEAVDKFKF